ncbi:MAG TPA: hypothetical protein VGJ83_01520 [Gemmatimonadales bacterium]
MPPMHRARPAALALLAAALAACGENGPATSPRLVIAPVLDSLFVGDSLAPPLVRYFDARGDSQPTGPIQWSSSDTTVFTVNSATGAIAGAGPGAALLTARAHGLTGIAVLVVSRVLDVSLLLDTIYLMPGDTLTIAAQVRAKAGGPAAVWYRSVPNAFHTLDSSTGRDSAKAPGPAQRFIVFATLGADTVADTGATEVVQLSDTTGGKAFLSVLGTAIQRVRAGARAVNYRRDGDTLTFRVSLPVVVQGVTVENLVITLRDSINAPGTFSIDSISPTEAFGAGSDFVCRPARPWALWSIQTVPPLRALSRSGGSIRITQVVSVAHGRAVSGRFEFNGQRTDLYDDPLGALPIRGTFVAPLIADTRQTCS